MVRASQQSTVAAALGRRPGVLKVEANPVAQSATVVYDPRRTSLAELRRWVTECGYHCAGQLVPVHVCDPMEEPDPPGEHAGYASRGTGTAVAPGAAEHAGHGAGTAERVDHERHERHAERNTRAMPGRRESSRCTRRGGGTEGDRGHGGGVVPHDGRAARGACGKVVRHRVRAAEHFPPQLGDHRFLRGAATGRPAPAEGGGGYGDRQQGGADRGLPHLAVRTGVVTYRTARKRGAGRRLSCRAAP
ncbi:heavy metal-associated domain-containing protein [Streptomyces sp. SID9913]|uniref:heavy-metal-associated domain-containing protein n=1 Tax=Streptomyces sp. SID9913 TaxID=2706117 RepID=UPI001EF1C284|nr:heavy metal-associated domain-containing protein [Streptomyces sp. SID9913]